MPAPTAEATSSGPVPRALGAVFALLVAAFGAVATLKPIADLDLFFHLKEGEQILDTHAVPRIDTFSFTFAGRPIRLVDAGSDALLAWLHRAGGLEAMMVLTALLVAVALLVAAARISAARPSLLLLVGALVLVFATSAFRFIVRPQTFMFVLLGVELWLFERAEAEAQRARRRRALWWMLPLLALWSNLHSSSLIGVTLLGAYCLGRMTTAVRARGLGAARREIVELIALAAAGAAASLVASNPLGRIATLRDVMASSYVAQVITEWQPPSPSLLMGPTGALAALVIVGFALDRRRVAAWEWLVHGVSLWLALRHVRFVPLAALVTGPAGALHLARAALDSPRLALAPLRPAADRALAALLVAGAALVAFGLDEPTPWLGDARRPRFALADDRYPVAAADWIARERPAGHMFHSYLFSGYLLYRLAPETPVFIDGRNSNLYDEAFLREIVECGPKTWRALFAKYAIDFAVVVHGDLAASIGADKSWALVWFDDLSAIYVRRGGPNDALVERRGYRALSLSALPTLLGSAAQADPALVQTLLDEAGRAVAEAPLAALPLSLRAMVRRALGDAAGSERDLVDAVGRNPRLADPWYRLALVHLDAGRADLARVELAHAVELRPEHSGYRELWALACLRLGDREAAREAARPLAPSRAELETLLDRLEQTSIGRPPR